MGLDNRPPISKQFNETALQELEKRIAEAKLRKEERARAFAVRAKHDRLAEQEKKAFKDQKERARRLEVAKEAIRKENLPKNTPELTPTGTRRGLSEPEIAHQASFQIENEHQRNLEQIERLFENELKDILNPPKSLDEELNRAEERRLDNYPLKERLTDIFDRSR